ncbi:MAG: gamma-glutamyltransferase [Planctomycetes bacterium]|nr:gamma-glutamyltransferase [Planctomycetota bacterium]
MLSVIERRLLAFLCLVLVAAVLPTAALLHAREPAAGEALWKQIEPFAKPPEEFAGKFGGYKSPLKFADGSIAKTPADWAKRRAEIRTTWDKRLGAWPKLVEKPVVKKLQKVERDGYTEYKVQVQISNDGKFVDGYLLIPKGKGPFPAVLVPFYEPLTSIGQGAKGRGVGTHDYGLQMVKRGCVTLSIGTPGSLDKLGGDTRDALIKAGEELRRQPLTLLAYVAANCLTALAQMPEVIAERIGVIGLSYGGKWSMFASCLDERFACAVWSDPGIVFNEKDSNVNYWEPWYLGYDPKEKRKAGVPSEKNPRTGLYREMVEAGEDLVDLHALMAPRPVMVGGGVQDPIKNWQALNHLVEVNKVLGHKNRAFLTARKSHIPTPEALELELAFLEYHLKYAPLDKPAKRGPAIGTKGMVSCGHPLAAQAGLDILDAGGNAFDAAVAVAATLNVVEPMMSGMGGFGVHLVYDASKKSVHCLDSSGRFPALTNADVFRAPTPHYLKNRAGARAIATPGNANGWEVLTQRHGILPWSRLFEPAIKLADEGFVISPRAAGQIKSEFDFFPEHAKAFYGKDGKPLQAGDRLVQTDLARSLRLIAKDGAKALHGGELGVAIDKEMQRSGGFLRLDDLKANRAEWWTPISIDYRGVKVVASPLPNNAWNGLYRLGIMSRFDVAKMGHNSTEYLHTYAEATKLAYTARLQYAGDRDLNPPPFERLFSEKQWASEAAKIKPNKAMPLQAAPPAINEDEQFTTHFVIADQWGNVVTSTQTLGMLFGSKIMAPGTGIWLNNSMQYCTFEPKGNPLDAIAGRRKLAGFCPMIVMKEGKPWIATGSPGGHTIVQTVPQIVMNIVDFRMDVQQAIAAPRLSFIEPDITAVDPDVPESVRKELAAYGHNIRVQRLGNAHGLTVEYDKGRPTRFTGAADPRGEGAAMGK